MPKPRKTPEDVCVEYAICVELVRAQTRIVRANHCTVADRPSERSFTEGSMTPCYDDVGIDREEWCNACVVRHDAVEDRNALRKRLRVAKRSIEAVGKRLNAELQP